MSRTLGAMILVTSMVVLAACGGASHRAGVVPPIGGLFMDVQAPLTVDFDKTPNAARQGSAQVSYLFVPFGNLSFSWGESAIEAAAEDGGLNTVEYADYQVFNVLGIWQTFTVTAYGN